MISRAEFGRTGHHSSRVIFGAWALNKATPEEAENVMRLLQAYGVNSIDTAPMYGNAEKALGQWLTNNRKDYFIATKTRSRSREGALKNLKQSLDNLRVNQIDLWQIHGLTNPSGWEKVMGPDGALEALIEARDNGQIRFLGVTGHGINAPLMHIRSLERFDFDSVLLPYNYMLMQNPRYAADFIELVEICKKKKVALQTIKSIVGRPWGDQVKRYNTYYYEPLESQITIDKAVHWSMGLSGSFLISAGDLELLPRVLDAADRFDDPPSEQEMSEMVRDYNVQSIFLKSSRGKGRMTWGGKMSRLVEKMISEGFFDYRYKRNLEQVIDELGSRGLPSRDKRKNVASALSRRVKNGVLSKSRESNKWVYWVEACH